MRRKRREKKKTFRHGPKNRRILSQHKREAEHCIAIDPITDRPPPVPRFYVRGHDNSPSSGHSISERERRVHFLYILYYKNCIQMFCFLVIASLRFFFFISPPVRCYYYSEGMCPIYKQRESVATCHTFPPCFSVKYFSLSRLIDAEAVDSFLRNKIAPIHRFMSVYLSPVLVAPKRKDARRR